MTLLVDAASNDESFDELGVRLCARLPAGFPDEWRNLQLSVRVGVIFTEWNGINPSFFEVCAVSSVEEALTTMTNNAPDTGNASRLNRRRNTCLA
jgi:hypothetical protein